MSAACGRCDGRGWYYTEGARSYGRERCVCFAPLSDIGRAQVGDATACDICNVDHCARAERCAFRDHAARCAGGEHHAP